MEPELEEVEVTGILFQRWGPVLGTLKPCAADHGADFYRMESNSSTHVGLDESSNLYTLVERYSLVQRELRLCLQAGVS